MKNIKLIVLDVDGVLTDGKLHISTSGEELKSFHTQDGMGITLAHYVGMKTAIITGRQSAAVTKRATELKINYVYQAVDQKFEVLEQLLTDLQISLDQVCYIGDDVNDLPILNRVGFSAAPNNAVQFVKKQVEYVASKDGGSGAVREIIDHILQREFDYESLIESFLNGNLVTIQ